MLENGKTKEVNKLIPLRRFTQEGPYSSAYLSLLVQRKKLKAQKIGRNYFTTKEWFNEYLETHARDIKRALPKIENGKDLETEIAKEILQTNLPTELLQENIPVCNREDDKIAGAMNIPAKSQEVNSVLKVAEEFIPSERNFDPDEMVTRDWVDRVEVEKKRAAAITNNFGAEEKKSDINYNKFFSALKNKLSDFIKLQNFNLIKKASAKNSAHAFSVFKKDPYARKQNSALQARLAAGVIGLFAFALFADAAPELSTRAYSGLKNFSSAKINSATEIILSGKKLLLESDLAKKINHELEKTGINEFAYNKSAAIGEKIEFGMSGVNFFASALKEEISCRNQILSYRISRAGGEFKFISSFWSAQAKNFKSGFVRAKNNSAFVVNNLMGRNLHYGNSLAKQNEGVVLGETESNSGNKSVLEKASLAFNYSIAHAKKTIKAFDLELGSAIGCLADKQNEISFALAEKTSKLALGSAGKVKGVSESSSDKIYQAGNKISETNQGIVEYGKMGKIGLSQQIKNSFAIASKIYSKAFNYLIPDSLIKELAISNRKGEVASASETNNAQIGFPQSGLKVVNPNGSSLNKKIVQPKPNEKATSTSLSKNLVLTNIQPADSGKVIIADDNRFKKITVIGATDLEGEIFNSKGDLVIDDNLNVKQTLSAKNLIVSNSAVFDGSIEGASARFGSLNVNNNLTVNGNSFVNGTQTVAGHLFVSGTFTAGHAYFPSLGARVLSGDSLSAGSGGLSSDGDTTLSGDNVIIAGATDLNNTLDIDKNSNSALTVGDGSSDNLAVNTIDDVVTINADTNLNGNLNLTGSININGSIGIGTSTPDGAFDVNGALIIENQNELRFFGLRESGSVYAALKATSSMASNIVWTLPSTDGVAGKVLTTNGNGNLYWANGGGLIATPLEKGNFVIGDDSGMSQATSTIFLSSDGNFGIGSTSPLTKLTVQGVAGQPILNIASSTGASLVYVGANGNVGIGTTDPEANLEVKGINGIKVSGSAGSAVLRMYDSINFAIRNGTDTDYGNLLAKSINVYGTVYGYGFSTTNNNMTVQPKIYFDQNAGDLYLKAANAYSDASVNINGRDVFVTGGNPVGAGRYGNILLGYNGTGNVAIGTTSPLTKLSVQGTAGQPVLNIASSTGESLVYVNEKGNVGIGTDVPQTPLDVKGIIQNTSFALGENFGEIRVRGSNNPMTFYTTSLERMRITGDGKVGIGTMSPADALHVNGNLRLGSIGKINTESGDILLQSTTADNTILRIAVGNNAPTSAGAGFYLTNNGASPADSPSSSFGMFASPSKLGLAMFINDSASDMGNNIIFTNIGNRMGVFNHAAQANPTLWVHSNTNPASDSTQWLSLVHDQTNGIIATGKGNIVLNPAGNVGIGTTSPLTKLSVQGSVGQPLLNIASSTGESLVYVNERGNVGIGTASPGSILEISNTFPVGGRVRFSDSNATTLSQNGAGFEFYHQSIKDAVLSMSSGSLIITTAGTGGNLQFGTDNLSYVMGISAAGGVSVGKNYYNTDAGSNNLIVQGNVGIGTTSPVNIFHAYNSGGSEGASISVDSGNGYSFLKFRDNNIERWAIENDGATDDLWFREDGNNSNVRLTIQEGGNVGIGTTTPNSKLSIYAAADDSTINFGDSNMTRFTMGTDYSASSTLTISAGSALGTNDLISISETGTVFHTPTVFESAGDLALANNLVFDNPTVSYIRSSSNLSLEAGEVFNSSDLTLRTYNYGQIILETLGEGGGTQINASSTISALTVNQSGETLLRGPIASFMAGDYEAMRLTSSGSLGIGTTSPLTKLSVQGTAGQPVLNIASSTGQSLVYVSEKEKVGIGTASPGYLLDVKGTSATGAIRSDIGFDIYPVPDPAAPTASLSAGGSVDDGDHWYGVTYTTDIGETHVVYTAAVVTTGASNNTVTLTIPVSSDPRVTGRKIYRTKAGDHQYQEYLLATVSNNTDTAYVDTVADSSLTGNSSLVYFKPNTTSRNITVNGTKALTIDTKMTAVGYQAANAVTTGGRNTFYGYQAGLRLTTGNDSLFVGAGAGYNFTTGSWNTAVGGSNTLSYATTGSGNTAVGGNAGTYVTAGSNNTAIGMGALYGTYTHSNSNNTAIGYQSFYGVDTGINNIGLGIYSGKYETGSYKLIIDNRDRVTEAAGEANALIYGVSSATPGDQILALGGGGNVGIGTTSPSERLEVAGNLKFSSTGNLISWAGGDADRLQFYGRTASNKITTESGYTTGFYAGDSQDAGTWGNMSFYTSSNQAWIERMKIAASGNIGIGTSSPLTKLSVQGTAGQPVLNIASSTGESLFYVNESGKVGIGTINPGAVLDIGTKTGVGTTYVLQSLGVQTVNPGAKGWTLGISSTRKLDMLWNYSAAGADHYASISTNQSDNDLIFQANGGNVGIGTTSPAGILNLASAANTRITLSDTNAAVNQKHWFMNSDSGLFSIGTTSDALVTDANYRALTITSGGLVGIGTMNPTYKLDVAGSARLGSGDEAMRVAANGNVGIGTSSPSEKLHIGSVAAGANVRIANGFLCVDNNDSCSNATTAGTVYAVGSYTTGADYAEYFKTKDTDLKPGEVVCVDIANDNSVERCERGSDGNLMGVVSTNPAIVGNNIKEAFNNPNYKIIAMLGQIPAKVSNENGPIRPGDSLTSASSTPGYAMKANAGDPTVGVALEELNGDKGEIKILISRRNKSLTVEQVEEQVTERVADMEIEDEVNILIADAINKLDINDEINSNLDPKLLLLETKLSVKNDETEDKLINLEAEIDSVVNVLAGMDNKFSNFQVQIADRISNLAYRQAGFEFGISNQISMLNDLILNSEKNISVDENGNIKLGNNSSSSTPAIASVEIVTATSNETTAFVVNQRSNNNVADFQARDVSILNISSQGKVSIVGELMIDGRLMACSGGACGAALDSVVDDTMGDIGVEGKVVAGAFEGYCEEGFVWVPGSAKYGTLPGFCAEITLTPSPSPADAASEGSSSFAVNVSQGEAQIACQSIGNGYHLISENEWMTIADNISKNNKNDMDQNISGMQLALNNATSTSYYLMNNNQIVLTGNLGEWTSQTVTGKGVPEIDLNASGNDGWYEYGDVIDYKGLNIAPDYYLSNTDNYIGLIKIGNENKNVRGFVRGFNGIYSLDLSHAPNEYSENIGYRCAK